MFDKPDVVVVGSGVLGSAMAAVLARDGRRVTVVERDLREPDRIVGELLQPGGCLALQRLGLADCLDDLDAHEIEGYVVHNMASRSCVDISYPSQEHGGIKGRAFHHGRFVTALRKVAQAEQNTHYVEGTVVQLIEENGVINGVKYRDKSSGDLKKVQAALTVVADGCFSKFRKDLVKGKPRTKSHFVGLLMEDCPQQKAHHAELVLVDPSPVLVYQISTCKTRVLVDIRGGLPQDLKAFLADSIHPHMPEHLKDPFMDAVQNHGIKTMPNSFLPPAPLEKAGVLCLGDAFNMRHPLTGGGMSVALNDVLIVRDLFRQISDLRDRQTVQEAVRDLYSRRKNHHSFVVDVLAMALYELFAANDKHLMKLKEACFAYFKLGGECVSGPVGLLSVLTPRPHILIGHFFAVALYAVYHTFRTEPWWAVHRSVSQSTGIFYRACSVIFPLMWAELKPAIL